MLKTWSRALEILKNRMEPEQFETWLSPIRPADNGENLLLEVPDEFFARWVRDNYMEMIRDAVWDTARRHVGIDFKILEGRSSTATERETPEDRQIAQQTVLAGGQQLIPRFTFGHFVLGPGNEMAHSASMMIARKPGGSYNPLFIHGGVGLGKTHMIQAIGHLVKAEHPGLKVVYTTGESFVNEVMSALKFKRLDTLRYRYRGQCDVLLLDDIHYLAGKEFAQEEFFHTFNDLYNGQRQVVLTCDQDPSSLAQFSERLRSRFQWGLITDILPPDRETRIRILLSKADRDSFELPLDVAEFLAERFPSSVRELEGAMNRVTAHTMIRKVPLTLDIARRVIERIITDRRGRLNADLVIKVVADYFQLTPMDIRSPKRHRAVSVPRQIAMRLLRDHTDLSLPAIGAAFGGRSHTTVLAALHHIQALEDTEPATMRAIKDIERSLGVSPENN